MRTFGYLTISILAAGLLAVHPALAAQDYNSSRSNNEASSAASANHNTTRSNRTQPAAATEDANGEDSDIDNLAPAAAPKGRDAASGMATGKRQHNP